MHTRRERAHAPDGVVAHTLPIGSVVDGLLGMDFLAPLGPRLLITEGVIEVPWSRVRV